MPVIANTVSKPGVSGVGVCVGDMVGVAVGLTVGVGVGVVVGVGVGVGIIVGVGVGVGIVVGIGVGVGCGLHAPSLHPNWQVWMNTQAEPSELHCSKLSPLHLVSPSIQTP